MQGKSHLLLGAVAGGYTGLTLAPPDKPVIAGLIAGGCILGSVLPDIDTPSSHMGHIFPFISYPVNTVCGHRGKDKSNKYVGGILQGLFHAPLPYFVLFLLSLLIIHSIGLNFGSAIFFGLTLGCLLHLFQDLCTKGGIPILWPLFRKNISICPISTGSIFEIILTIIMCGLFIGFHNIIFNLFLNI